MRIATLCCLIAGASAFGTLHTLDRLVSRYSDASRREARDDQRLTAAVPASTYYLAFLSLSELDSLRVM